MSVNGVFYPRDEVVRCLVSCHGVVQFESVVVQEHDHEGDWWDLRTF